MLPILYLENNQSTYCTVNWFDHYIKLYQLLVQFLHNIFTTSENALTLHNNWVGVYANAHFYQG